MPNFFKQSLTIILLGVVLFAFQLFAFNEPIQSPPQGNTSAPLNIGSTGQTKQGWLASLKSFFIGSEPTDVEKATTGVLRTTGGAILNTGGAATSLIASSGGGTNTGKVGIGNESPTAKLDILLNSLDTINPLSIAKGASNYLTVLNNGNVGIGVASPTQKLDVAGYIKGQSGLCMGNNCITQWPRISNDCIKKRSQIISKDSVIYCPSDYPISYSCNIIDDEASVTPPTNLSGYCNSDGLCDASLSAPAEYERKNLGQSNAYLETVVNSSGVGGCWQYDYGHARAAYRLEIMCCK